MRSVLLVTLLCFVSLTYAQNGARGELYLSFQSGVSDLDRAALANEFFHKNDLGKLSGVRVPPNRDQKSFGISYLRKLAVSDNYRHQINIGGYARASFMSTTLTERHIYMELERDITPDRTYLVESYTKEWVTFQSDQLELGITAQALYRFNRRLNLRYGLNIGAAYPFNNRLLVVENTEIRRTTITDNSEDKASDWTLDSKVFESSRNVLWGSRAGIGLDYKLFENKPFYLGGSWIGSVSHMNAAGHRQMLKSSGFEIRVISSF